MSVVINQLRISDSGKKMYIDAHVNKADYFADIYIKKVTICTEDQVSELNYMSYTNYVKQVTFQENNLKEISLMFTPVDFNEYFDKTDFSHNMFFVYIECIGTPDPCTPCRLDEMTTLGVTFDDNIIYNQAMNYTRELADTCNIPQNYLNFILNYDALKLAINTDHFIPAINYWKTLTGSNGVFNSNKSGSTHKSCGCYG